MLKCAQVVVNGLKYDFMTNLIANSVENPPESDGLYLVILRNTDHKGYIRIRKIRYKDGEWKYHDTQYKLSDWYSPKIEEIC